MIDDKLEGGEHAAADPVRGDEQGEGPVPEVDGQQLTS